MPDGAVRPARREARGGRAEEPAREVWEDCQDFRDITLALQDEREPGGQQGQVRPAPRHGQR